MGWGVSGLVRPVCDIWVVEEEYGVGKHAEKYAYIVKNGDANRKLEVEPEEQKGLRVEIRWSYAWVCCVAPESPQTSNSQMGPALLSNQLFNDTDYKKKDSTA